MPSNLLELRVNGRAYGGWKSARITRSIESLSGTFELSVSSRWPSQREAWPINEEDECALALGDDVVLTGWVDRRSLSISPDDHGMNIAGKDAAAALVECSAKLGRTWEFYGVGVDALARKLAAPFDISVSVDVSALPLPVPPNRIAVDPGESAFEVLEKACRQVGVLAVSDGQGGLVLTRGGSALATSRLVEGQNIKAGSSEFDATGRFASYFVSAQHPGSDDSDQFSTANILGSAVDVGVKRSSRVLLVRAEGAADAGYAARRAQWEAKVRAARAETASVTVQGWRQADGELWPLNGLVQVDSPNLEIFGIMLITEQTFRLDEGGGTTLEMKLKRPDAFVPEPIVRAATWPELTGGVKK